MTTRLSTDEKRPCWQCNGGGYVVPANTVNPRGGAPSLIRCGVCDGGGNGLVEHRDRGAMMARTRREVCELHADEADYLAHDCAELSDALWLRVWTGVLNGGRGRAVSVPLSERERRTLSAILDASDTRKGSS